MTNNSQVAFSVGVKSLTVMKDGDVHMLDDTDKRFSKIKVLLEKKPPKIEEALKLMDLKAVIAKTSAGRVTIDKTGVTFEGAPVSGYMAERLVDMASIGMDVKPWMRFMDNLQENPQNDIRDDVFRWMEQGKMPITEDGCIVAFKKVRSDYKDVHSGSMDYSVGTVVQMSREQCDTSRHNTCSRGLHFCSADYLRQFGGQRVMIVKIDPRDVTAIPTDYNNAKGRCCRLEVTGELSSESAARHKVFDEPTMPVDPQEIPDLMAREPSKTSPRTPGPKSTIGTKESSRRVAANASQAKGARKSTTTTKTPTRKGAPKKSGTARTKQTSVSTSVTKAASKATKSVKKAGTKIIKALEEAVSPTPKKATVRRVSGSKFAGKSKVTGKMVLKPATKPSAKKSVVKTPTAKKSAATKSPAKKVVTKKSPKGTPAGKK